MVRRQTPTKPSVARATSSAGEIPSRSSSHHPNAANSTGIAANSKAWASASPNPRFMACRSAQGILLRPSEPGCAVTTHSPHSRPDPPPGLVNVITMYPAPDEGVKSGVSPEGPGGGQRAASSVARRLLRSRALFLLLTAGGEVDDVLDERGGVGGIERGVAGRSDPGMEHDVEEEPERRH